MKKEYIEKIPAQEIEHNKYMRKKKSLLSVKYIENLADVAHKSVLTHLMGYEECNTKQEELAFRLFKVEVKRFRECPNCWVVYHP